MNSCHTHICGLLHMTHVNLKLENNEINLFVYFLPLFFVAFYHLHDIFFHWSFTLFLCILCVIYRAFFLLVFCMSSFCLVCHQWGFKFWTWVFCCLVLVVIYVLLLYFHFFLVCFNVLGMWVWVMEFETWNMKRKSSNPKASIDKVPYYESSCC